jgi:hypothetical protein
MTMHGGGHHDVRGTCGEERRGDRRGKVSPRGNLLSRAGNWRPHCSEDAHAHEHRGWAAGSATTSQRRKCRLPSSGVHADLRLARVDAADGEITASSELSRAAPRHQSTKTNEYNKKVRDHSAASCDGPHTSNCIWGDESVRVLVRQRFRVAWSPTVSTRRVHKLYFNGNRGQTQ